jgi:hypothetical protein
MRPDHEARDAVAEPARAGAGQRFGTLELPRAEGVQRLVLLVGQETAVPDTLDMGEVLALRADLLRALGRTPGDGP